MFPEPRELTKDDLTSADALMADDVFTMNATLSSVIENALGHPIPGLEVRFRDLELSAEVPQIKSGSLEVPTLWTQVQQGVGAIFGSKQFTVEKKILRGVTGAFKPGRITLVLGQPGSGKSSLMKVLANRFHMDKNITLSGDIEYNGKERSLVLDMLPRDVATDGISCKSLQNAPPTIGDMTLKEYVEETFDMKHSDIWRNAMILIILIVVFRILALFSLRYINHLKR
ncbi:ABC transporter G family member 31 [Phytophthora cinnamomi]|uniref:ABC transporter G family member 31 n=1 Tax=Phytophthora cinnamomi TaxID=4785 RepID=UPI00355A5B21|nr:ABC transporter G family member 31 [Phytophthora cinnamomi]